MYKRVNEYDYLSKINYCTHWHINSPELLLCLCVVFYSSFVYTCVWVFLHIQSPLRECRSIRSGASGLPYYCAPLVCVSAVMELLAVWWHNKPKTKHLPREMIDTLTLFRIWELFSLTMSLLTPQHTRTTGVLVAGILTILYSSGSVLPGHGAGALRV